MMSDPQQDRNVRIREVFAAVLASPPDERITRLSRLCEDDPGLREEIESLLSASALPGLDQPALGVGFNISNALETVSAFTVSRIGNCRIVKQLSAGATADTYLAEQEDPKRTVVVKVLRPGESSEAIGRRFRQEQDLLARLNHTLIVPIHASGTTSDGRPYFVMEFVDGNHLTMHTKIQRLDDRGILQLFCEICRAVGHAHKHGVIHRDLKPANIIVTTDGLPKIIDFGIAKDATLDADYTAEDTYLGTLNYASPEQLTSPKSVDPRADVYGLGVLLFELVAGTRPYDANKRPFSEAIDTIVKETPPRLRSIAAHTPRNLEEVVCCCLRKDPRQRYCDANELAEDIRRVLDDRAIKVHARRPLHVGWAFLKRHRLAACSALLIIAILTALNWWNTQKETQRVSISTRAVADVVRVVEQRLTSQLNGPPISSHVLYPLLSQVEQLREQSPDDLPLRRTHVRLLMALGDALMSSAGAVNPRKYYSDANQIARRTRSDSDPEMERVYARTIIKLADTTEVPEEVLRLDKLAYHVQRELYERTPSRGITDDLSWQIARLGRAAMERSDSESAKQYFTEQVRLTDELLLMDNHNPQHHYAAAIAHSAMASVFKKQGKSDRELAHLEQTRKHAGIAVVCDKNNRNYTGALAQVLGRLAFLHTWKDGAIEAADALSKYEQLSDRLNEQFPSELRVRKMRFKALTLRANLEHSRDNRDGAAGYYAKASVIGQELLEEAPEDTDLRCAVARNLHMLSRYSKDPEEAERAWRGSVRMWKECAERRPKSPDVLVDLSYAMMRSPVLEAVDMTEALRWARKAVEVSGNRNPRPLRNLMIAHMQAGDFESASAAGQEALRLVNPDSALAKEIVSQLNECGKKGN